MKKMAYQRASVILLQRNVLAYKYEWGVSKVFTFCEGAVYPVFLSDGDM